MSDGIKAWAEEAQAEELRRKIEAFKSLDPASTAVSLANVLDNLQRLDEGSIALTKHQWNLLGNSIKILKTILSK